MLRRYAERMLRRTHPDATRSTRRLEAFTDGVFAIAATLLVLDLTTYDLGSIDGDGAMWAALLGMWPLLFNFLLSFTLLCLLWSFHAEQFEQVTRTDATLVWLNNARLVFVVLVPFATNLTTEYSDTLAGRLAMPVVFGLAIAVSWLQALWISRHREDLAPDQGADQTRSYARGALTAVVVSTAVVVAAPFVGSFAFLLFVLDRPLTKLLQRRRPATP
jgi:uncharacterized membrane protein